MFHVEDLEHLRTVTVEKHNRFAGVNKLASYFMSAKSSDAVHSCFFRMAADLANVVLSKAEIDTASVSGTTLCLACVYSDYLARCLKMRINGVCMCT